MQLTVEYIRQKNNIHKSLDSTTQFWHRPSDNDGAGPPCKLVDFLSCFFYCARKLVDMAKSTLVCE